MTPVDTRRLTKLLGARARSSLDGAVRLANSRTNFHVELEHWVLALLDVTDGDFVQCLARFEVDAGRLAADLNGEIDRLKRGNSRTPGLAEQIVELIRSAWLVGSVEHGATSVRTGHLLLALVTDQTLARWSRDVSRELAKVNREQLAAELQEITQDSAEAGALGATGSAAAPGGGAPQSTVTGGPALAQFTIDLTALARSGKIDPVLGRDEEIRQLVDVLMRRRQNNPILTGEAGVGKTSVVEGLALKIAAGEVPPALQNVTLRTLDLGLLQAGAGMKGEFENRLRQVIDEVKTSPTPIILFVDEAHTMIGAGGQAGQNDAANLLKPALARGELRTIAATTWAEYKKYFERDPALTRRFQVVKVDEPADAAAIDMMRGLVATLEKHHKVRVLDSAVMESVRLSRRYIPARQLPDKSVSLIDTACARVAMSQSAVPAEIEACRRQIASLETYAGILTREAATGAGHEKELQDVRDRKARIGDELGRLESRWKREKALVAELREIAGQLEKHAELAPSAPGVHDIESLRQEFAAKETALAQLQGESPLVRAAVDGQAVAEVVGNWTGIPVGRMLSNEVRTILALEERMSERIVGQPQALSAIAQAMRTSRAQLTDPRKPIGVFLMVGTSGVGKTETALTLAELLYGGDQQLTTINMSEFKEQHKVSMLVGSPPGYIGYGEGGVLTEAVRRRPYSVVLLDEMEKAHPGVQDVFYQVFDKGQLRDGEGRDIDFRNTVIIMTSNAGTDTIAKLCADPDTMPDADGLAEALRPELLKIFKPAFLGRVTVVPYFPLSDAVLRLIVKMQLDRICKRVNEHYRVACTYDTALIESIAARCREVESGARNVESILARGLLPELSSRILARMADGGGIGSVHVGAGPGGELTYELTHAME